MGKFRTLLLAMGESNVGDIKGAFGTIALGSEDVGRGFSSKLKTLLAIIGPGLIVMVGDNDAGAFGTYTQAGQNYGTRLLWTLLLLIPVIYVNQEMVLRLGAVTGVGYAKLIMERFGRFWGALSVINLVVLNALTLVTEFIGVSLGLSYLGLPKVPGVIVAAIVVVAAASTGSFRRFERICLFLVAGSLILFPIVFMAHPSASSVAHDLVVPGIPSNGQLSAVILLILAIIGTTVAPWQLFFQQSYVIDKHITPKYVKYEKADLWIGLVTIVIEAGCMMAFCAAAFFGHPGSGNFTDAGGIATGLGDYVSKVAGILFAIALIDASIIGASAVGLSTSYAIGDVLHLKRSLHRSFGDAKIFYTIFAGLMVLSAVVVLIPNSPLGLITEGVQVMAGVLLPAASLFLLMLCNDKDVLGPWVNGKIANIFTTIVIAVLAILSVILVVAVLYPAITPSMILYILIGGGILSAVISGGFFWRHRADGDGEVCVTPECITARENWRMPPVEALPPPVRSHAVRLGLKLLATYMILASVMVVVHIIQLAVS